MTLSLFAPNDRREPVHRKRLKEKAKRMRICPQNFGQVPNCTSSKAFYNFITLEKPRQMIPRAFMTGCCEKSSLAPSSFFDPVYAFHFKCNFLFFFAKGRALL